MRDLKWILKILLFAALALIIISMIFPSAKAEDNASYIIVSSPVVIAGPIYPLTPQYRLAFQGDVVYVNDTVDISGQGWGEGVAWYGHWGEYEYPQYIRMFTPYKRDQQQFYIDPAIFKDRWGMWYQYYGNVTERNGNLATFFVKDSYRSTTNTYPNGTVVNTTMGISNASSGFVEPVTLLLPDVKKSDYNLAHGNNFDTGFERMWVFGRTTGYYAHTGSLNITEVNTMEPGAYKIVQHSKGANGIFEVGYDPSRTLLTSPWRNKQEITVYGSQPMLDIEKVIKMIGETTDDTTTMYSMEVSEPSITIVSIDEVDVGARIPIAYQPGMTLLDIRGYTNVAKGDIVSFVLDPDNQNARTLRDNTYSTKAQRTSPGMMSMYQIYIPINKNEMTNGMHTIEARTRIGGSMRYDFPISELPPDSYVPNATLKYIMDENPWKPNLTIPDPIVVVQTQIIEKTVIKEVPPSNETVYEQQKKALDDKVIESGVLVVELVGGLAIAFLIVRFAYRTWKRKGWE